MKNILSICLTICFASVFAFAQNQPLESFNIAVKQQPGGFNGNKENLSTIFNQERIRLGENFETELWKYLGKDIEKHYWIGSFLQSKSYLHGNSPLPELALKVWQNALALIGEKNDDKSLGNKFKISVLSTILAINLNKKDLALSLKNDSENITNSGFNTKIYFPALNAYEICLYQNIGLNISVCREEEDNQKSKEKIINAGILNGKAISLPQAKYPQQAKDKKISGIVRIKILIDTNGKVVSAEGVSGNPELFVGAIEAAKKAEFKPTLLSGEPVKVSGFLVYQFIY